MLHENSATVLHKNSVTMLHENSATVLHENSVTMLHENSATVQSYEKKLCEKANFTPISIWPSKLLRDFIL